MATAKSAPKHLVFVVICFELTVGTCLNEIFPDSDRGDQKSVLLGTPISGGGSDPKLTPVRTLSKNHGRSSPVSHPIPPQWDLPISWNIAPTQDVLTIRRHPETKQRTLDTLRWGLIPNWAKDPKIAYKTINARAETVDTAPSFRQAFMKRRCLIPSDGFYEWKKVSGGKMIWT
jgi:hypothetical protein